jgi:hypothetical protein
VAHPPVTLRPASPEDLPALQALARSDAVARYLSYVAAESYAAALEDPAQTVLVVEVDGRFAGGSARRCTPAGSR